MTNGGSQGGPYGEPYGNGPSGDTSSGDTARGDAAPRPQAGGAAWGPYNPYGTSHGGATHGGGATPTTEQAASDHGAGGQPPAPGQPGTGQQGTGQIPPATAYPGAPTAHDPTAQYPATQYPSAPYTQSPANPYSTSPQPTTAHYPAYQSPAYPTADSPRPGGPGAPGGPGGPGYGDGGPTGGGRPRRAGGVKGALIAGALVLGLVAGAIGGVVGAKVTDGGGESSLSSGPLGGDPNSQDTQQVQAPAGSTQEVAARVLPSVVSIDITEGSEQGEGSGIVLSDDGIIMTNNHVVSGSTGRPASDVQVNFNDGSRAAARVLGADPISDIAVLKVDKSGLKPITTGTSKNLAVGQDVIAIGAPLGLEGTVTTGIISALNRPVSTSTARPGGTTSVIDAIQTDAAINPGNSGGALVNARGALIGVNSAIATLGGGGGGAEQQQTGSIGLGFAIPIDQALRVANELRQSGRATHASLGVSVRPASDPETPGALISDVTAGGPAADAGIPSGAIVTKLGDRTIASGDALVAAVRSNPPGARVSVTYVANGRTQTAEVTLGTLTS